MKDPTKLFDFIWIVFNSPAQYKKLKAYEKARHFFMFSRFMAIQFPVQANALQHIKINPSEVIDYWQITLTRLYNKVPSWMYIKMKKAKAAKKKKFVEEETVKKYCRSYSYNRRQIDTALKFFEVDMEQELQQFEKMIKQ